MKHKSTLLLLAAVIIAAIVAWGLSQKPTTGELARSGRKLVPDLRPGDVTRVVVQTDEKEFVCEQEDGLWRIKSPLSVRGEPDRIEAIVRAFADARQQTRPIPIADDADAQPADYGLDRPRRVSFSSSRKRWTILVGNESGLGDLVYVSKDGEKIVRTIKQEVARQLDVNLNDLRSRKLLPPIPLSELRTLTITASRKGGPDTARIVCRKHGKRWEMREPLFDLADPQAVEELAKAIKTHTLSRQDFVSSRPLKPTRYGLDQPGATLTLGVGTERYELILSRHFSKGSTEFYARNPAEPTIVRIPQHLYEELSRPLTSGANSLRARSLADFTASQAGQLTISRGHRVVTAQKKGDSWRICGPESTAADAKALREMIAGLREVRVMEFVADTPDDMTSFGLTEEDAWNVRLDDQSGRTLARLDFGETGRGGQITYVRRPTYPPVLAVETREWITDLKTGRPALLDRTILELPLDRIVRVEIQRDGRRSVCSRNAAGAAWRLTEPVNAPADPVILKKMLGELNPLRSRAVVAEAAADLRSYGLHDPSVVLRINYRQDAQTSTSGAPEKHETELATKAILVGDRREISPEGYYAMTGRVKSGARVFILSPETIKAFRTELASRIIAKAVEVRRMEFASGNRSLEFNFDERMKLWRQPSNGAAPEKMQKALSSAATLLEDFRAERLAGYVVKDPARYGFDSPALTITFRDQRAGGKQIVLGGRLEGGGRYVLGPATGFVHVASETDVARLLAVADAGGLSGK
jgi:hypothetical protein